MLNTLHDGIDDDVLRVTLPYFEGHALRWVNEVTYTDGDPIASPEQYEWNHGLGETVQAVIDAGLRVTALREHTECEWRALRHMVEGAGREIPTGRDAGAPPGDVHPRSPQLALSDSPRSGGSAASSVATPRVAAIRLVR